MPLLFIGETARSVHTLLRSIGMNLAFSKVVSTRKRFTKLAPRLETYIWLTVVRWSFASVVQRLKAVLQNKALKRSVFLLEIQLAAFDLLMHMTTLLLLLPWSTISAATHFSCFLN